MVGINLLPKKIYAAQIFKIVLGLGCAGLFLLALFWTWQFSKKRSQLEVVKAEIEKVNAELNSPQLKQIVEEVEKFTRDRQDLETKRSVLDLLRKRHATYVRLLDILPDLVPARVQLTSLDFTEFKGAKKFLSQGEARSPEAMAEFYANLESHPVIRKVAMEAPPRLNKTSRGDMVHFNISFEAEEFQ